MRCQRCGRPVEGAGRLCAQCAGAVRRSSGVSGGRRPGRQASSAGSRPVPSVRSAGSRPVPSARPAGTVPAAGSPPRRRRRRASAKGWLFLLLLFAAFLAGYLLNPAGREPARPDGDVSRSQAVSPSAVSARAEAEALIPHFALRWYLQQLDEDTLENFCALYRAVMDFQEKVTFPNPVTKEDVRLLFFLVEHECPEVFQLSEDSRYTTHSSKGEVLYVTVNYGLQEADYRARAETCAGIARQAAAQAQGLSEWERELSAIRFLNANCVYDNEAADAGNAYGALVRGAAKCDGISLGFKWIAEEMGLTTFLLSGGSRDGDSGHAWNCIRIDGEFSDVDVTSDVPYPDEPCECDFRKCNVPRQVIAAPYILRDYITDNFTLPEADSMDGSYYARTGCYVRSGESLTPWLRELCAQVEREGSGSLALQFESQADYDRFGDEFAEAMNGLSFSVTYSGWHADACLWRRQTVSRN